MNKGAIATGSKEATEAAANILNVGGNAIDAAVSAAFTSMTSEFALTGVSGGGAMLIHISGQEPILYDFFVDTPNLDLNKKLDFKKAIINFGSSSQLFHIGKASVAVPGNLAGLLTVQNKYGKIPISVVIEPAIELARNGYKITKEQAYIFKILEPIFSHTAESKKLLFKNNNLLSEGDMFLNTDFSNFLERVANEGKGFFYRGDIAESIMDVLSDGGLINSKSLSNYKVISRKPVCTDFYGYKIFSNPAPSAGGSLIIFLLKIIKTIDKNNVSISKLINAMSLTNYVREIECNDLEDDMKFSKILNDNIFNKYLKGYNNSLLQNDIPKSRGCTTHVSVMDAYGNSASLTTSNGEGSGYIIPNTGIMLNNMLGEEDLNPNGFHKWIKPGRLSTMMSPSIILKDGKPEIIIGSGGSNRIRSAIVQVLINYIINGMNLAKSIESPRIHLENDQVFYEPGINIEDRVINENYNLNPFNDKNLFFGGVNSVSKFEAVSDSRRGGCAIIL